MNVKDFAGGVYVVQIQAEGYIETKKLMVLNKVSSELNLISMIAAVGYSDNSVFKKLAVQWLIEHSTSHQHLWWLDSFVPRNRQLLKPAKR